MIKVAKIIIGLCAALMFSFWIIWMLFPETGKALFQVDAATITGINSLKSDMGGFVLTAGIFMLLTLFNYKRWVLSASITTSGIFISRIFSIIADGYSVQAIGATVIEIIVLSACLILIMAKE